MCHDVFLDGLRRVTNGALNNTADGRPTMWIQLTFFSLCLCAVCAACILCWENWRSRWRNNCPPSLSSPFSRLWLSNRRQKSERTNDFDLFRRAASSQDILSLNFDTK
jgi:hypothetical protein